MFNLLKKDFIIIKSFWPFLIIFSILGPIFINYQTRGFDSSFISFIITILFLEFILYGSVCRLEEKDKGCILLTTMPYSRSDIVKSKYLFIGAIFIIAYVLYILAALITPIEMNFLSIESIVISFLVISVCFGIYIPIQYKYGTEKTKYISSCFVLISPLSLPAVIKWIQSKNIDLEIINKVPNLLKYMVIILLALVVLEISIKISINIYDNKDLI
ncbi:ABC-2 transporter family protein [[Clostridium] bifermentans ATCC 638]|uniref:ABC-2 transporter family protein n=1 Tax=Paraclostridium bifermentans ATCC 638 = DSM 14991 TaxID=1233171 RepID=T4VRM1_PARBF|nr:ABC-2 transporter permease [Paraclostridium bifermentans]EQK44118.1 ABC-2 transporter family protein [[Clostridium] bifermentans ATCC 638] [Paraclostridium bifermentans ATCC 638 = DSM 14991]RIZ58630.1 ABC-2 transporter permease [Paraclostridium bifermentans]UAG19857.1 ABC-2 transporter permease [Paraclostridium bifermentans]